MDAAGCRRRRRHRRGGMPPSSSSLASSSPAVMAVTILLLVSSCGGAAHSAAFLAQPRPARRAAAHRSCSPPPPSSSSALSPTDARGAGLFGRRTHHNHHRRRNLVVVVASSSSRTSPSERRSSSSPPPKTVDKEEAPDASDLEGVRLLFFTHCDPDGLMTLSTLRTSVGPIRELLDDGDLLPEELDDAWEAAVAVKEEEEERIDVDGFVRIYRDIDDLFEDDDDDEGGDEGVSADAQPQVEATDGDDKEDDDDDEEGLSVSAGSSDVDDDDPDILELRRAFDHLVASTSSSKSKSGLSREALRGWEEVDQLVSDGLLSEDEFDDIWTSSAAKSRDGEMMTLEGFLTFNAELDGLFEDEDEDDDDEEEEEASTATTSKEAVDESSSAPPVAAAVDVVVTEEGLPPAEIFARIADDDFLVGFNDIQRKWGELADMLESGDISHGELRRMFDDIPAAKGTTDGGAEKMIDEDGFVRLYEAIDDLFEDEDDDEGETGGEGAETSTQPTSSGLKEELLDLMDRINEEAEAQDQLTCGVSDEIPTDGQRAAVLDAVGRLEKDRDRNRILRVASSEDDTAEEITELDLAGEWELLYTSSAMMRFNNGLSGLGGSVPNGKFGGLRQTLRASRYLSDVEYTERIAVNPDVSSFDVKITGDWELKRSVSLLLGVPTVVMSVEPDKVTYGPTSTRADHWKSVRAMNLLDVTYLDDDLRIMRGSTSTDTLFIFRRV